MGAKRDGQLLTETAQRLKSFREKEGLTQTEFGKMIGKGQTSIARYELGNVTIPADIIKKVKNVFGLSLDWIYDGQGSSKKVPEKSNLITDIKTLEENSRILMNEIKSLKKEFKKLHNEFFEFKHGIQKKDKAN